jgi:inner membrane protein
LLTAGVTFRYLHVRFWPLFGLFFLVTASHGVLDAFTNGGFGIPFLWPFTDHRWGPYGPINVSDIAFELPDPRTSRAVRTELLYVWLPLGVAVVLTEGYRWLRRRPEHPARMR